MIEKLLEIIHVDMKFEKEIDPSLVYHTISLKQLRRLAGGALRLLTASISHDKTELEYLPLARKVLPTNELNTY